MPLQERSYSVLIVSAAENFNTVLGEMLPAAKFDTVRRTADVAAARRELAERSYDMVLINSPLPDDPGLRFAIDAGENKGTVVMIVVRAELQEDACQKLDRHGVFVLAKPLSRTTLEAAISWLISARERIRMLEKKTVSVEEKMEEIRLVNRAKWLLISQLNMDEPTAHRYIEKQAMDRCVSRREIAETIIKTYS